MASSMGIPPFKFHTLPYIKTSRDNRRNTRSVCRHRVRLLSKTLVMVQGSAPARSAMSPLMAARRSRAVTSASRPRSLSSLPAWLPLEIT